MFTFWFKFLQPLIKEFSAISLNWDTAHTAVSFAFFCLVLERKKTRLLAASCWPRKPHMKRSTGTPSRSSLSSKKKNPNTRSFQDQPVEAKDQKPSYDIFRRWRQGLFRPHVPCTPSLHCPIANSASTTANNQYVGMLHNFAKPIQRQTTSRAVVVTSHQDHHEVQRRRIENIRSFQY